MKDCSKHGPKITEEKCVKLKGRFRRSLSVSISGDDLRKLPVSLMESIKKIPNMRLGNIS